MRAHLGTLSLGDASVYGEVLSEVLGEVPGEVAGEVLDEVLGEVQDEVPGEVLGEVAAEVPVDTIFRLSHLPVRRAALLGVHTCSKALLSLSGYQFWFFNPFI